MKVGNNSVTKWPFIVAFVGFPFYDKNTFFSNAYYYVVLCLYHRLLYPDQTGYKYFVCPKISEIQVLSL